eukprot:3822089-Karenia_brevis.AAC.1
MEITSRYFGLPSPACAALVGKMIGGTGMRLDAHGFKLCAATLPGDGWRTQHDTIKWALFEDMRFMATRVTTEVYGLFAPLLPQAARDELEAQPARKRQGLVPDFLARCRAERMGPMRDTLLEVKTLHVGTTTYPSSEERCRAVSRRAAAIDSEYLAKARTLDRTWLGTPADGLGPIEAKLRGFGAVRAL